jgi:hypothetical protein
MKRLTYDEAEKFARDNFGKMPEAEREWNLIHVRCMIKAIEELSVDKKVNIEKIRTLAWVHDVGKIKTEENHAELSLEILKDFDLGDVDKDCILNHGSSGKPQSAEAKIFQAADGISLFYPETLFFRFWAKAKEGDSFEKVVSKIKEHYNKYLVAYADRVYAVDLLKNKFKSMFGDEVE